MHHGKSFPQVALIRMFPLYNFIHRFTDNFYIIGANATDSSAQLAFIKIITNYALTISRRKINCSKLYYEVLHWSKEKQNKTCDLTCVKNIYLKAGLNWGYPTPRSMVVDLHEQWKLLFIRQVTYQSTFGTWSWPTGWASPRRLLQL